jgi:hypothetical protein
MPKKEHFKIPQFFNAFWTTLYLSEHPIHFTEKDNKCFLELVIPFTALICVGYSFYNILISSPWTLQAIKPLK